MERRDFLKNSAVSLAAANLLSSRALASVTPQPKAPKAPQEVSLPSFKSSKEGPEDKGELGLAPEDRMALQS